MKTKKIAIVAEWMTSRGGAEKVVLELIKIFPNADIFTTVYKPDLFPELIERKITTSFLQKLPRFLRRHQLLLPLLPRAIESLDLKGYDLIISSSSSIGKGIKRPKGSIHICYCHTPMRYVWQTDVDNRLKRLPLGFLMIRTLKKWDLKSNRTVDYFLCNSNFTKQRIKKYYQKDALVIYPPSINEDEITFNKNSKRKEFYFAISRLISYKRLDLAIQACNILKKDLVIAGQGPEEERLKKLGGKTVVFLGNVNEQEKKELFESCRAVFFPAEEDFGIVPIEAMAYGAPVIAYGKGGATESVIDGETGVLFGKQDVPSIIGAVEKLDSLNFDEKRIKKNAERFSNKIFKDKILNLIEKI